MGSDLSCCIIAEDKGEVSFKPVSHKQKQSAGFGIMQVNAN
jgi:hypothetical protein